MLLRRNPSWETCETSLAKVLTSKVWSAPFQSQMPDVSVPAPTLKNQRSTHSMRGCTNTCCMKRTSAGAAQSFLRCSCLWNGQHHQRLPDKLMPPTWLSSKGSPRLRAWRVDWPPGARQRTVHRNACGKHMMSSFFLPHTPKSRPSRLPNPHHQMQQISVSCFRQTKCEQGCAIQQNYPASGSKRPENGRLSLISKPLQHGMAERNWHSRVGGKAAELACQAPQPRSTCICLHAMPC